MENHMSSYEVETNTILNIYTIIIKTITILGSLSLLSSLLVISMFLLKKHIRTFVCELIFYLAISEVFNSTSKILSIYRITLYTDIEQGLSDGTSLLCLIQRVFSIYSDFSTLILSMVISFALYDLMKRMNKDAVVRRMKCFRLTTFILPLIPTLSLSFIHYDVTQGPKFQCWCWIPSYLWYISLTIYSLYWMLILGNLYISLKTISFLKRKLHRDTISTHDQCLIRKAKNEEQVTKVIRKLYIYPIVSIILWSVASSSRVYEAILDSHHKDTDEDLVRLILYFLQAVFMSARGLIYTIIYFCRYEKSRKELNTMICGIRRYLCCQKKKKEDTFIGENYST